MYNVGLVRQLCRDIYGTGTDAQRELHLLFVLREVTTREVTKDVAEEDQDELRFRMVFLAETYLMAVRAEPIAWGSPAATAV